MGIKGQCDCGEVRFDTGAGPLFRAICHCTICQRFHGRSFGDFTVFRNKRAQLQGSEALDYKAWRLPPVLRRGKCVKCGTPSFEVLTLPPFPKLALIPTRVLADQDILPPPSFHMFYESRQADMPDDAPKCTGYLPSQAKFASVLTGALMRG